MRRTLLATLLSCLLLPAAAAAQDDIGAAREAVCCGAECCLIDGNCRTRGTTNPANSCEVCDPDMSQSAWSAVADCMPDAGSTDGSDGGDGGDGGCAVGPGGTMAPLAFVGLIGALLFWRRRS